MGLFNRIRPDPGFVSPVRSDPGFVSPIRFYPIRSDPDFLNGRVVNFCSIFVTFNLGRDSRYFCYDSRTQMHLKFPLLCTLVGDVQFS